MCGGKPARKRLEHRTETCLNDKLAVLGSVRERECVCVVQAVLSGAFRYSL